jgi:hypothetical protein
MASQKRTECQNVNDFSHNIQNRLNSKIDKEMRVDISFLIAEVILQI